MREKQVRELEVGDVILSPERTHLKVTGLQFRKDILGGSLNLKTACAVEISLSDGRSILCHPAHSIELVE